MNVNVEKSKVVHFRNPSIQLSQVFFMCVWFIFLFNDALGVGKYTPTDAILGGYGCLSVSEEGCFKAMVSIN